MQKTISNLLSCLVVILAIYPSYSAAARPNLKSTPTLTAITPNSFASGINQPVTITGNNLDGITSVKLGQTSLTNLQIIDATQISAQVPWDIQPGVYDLIATNASNQSAKLAAEVNISTAATGWASNGPYGGDIINLSLDSHNPDRIYVGARFSGVFETTDGAQSWHYEMITPMNAARIDKMHFVYPAGQTTPIMYIPGAGGLSGLSRSTDNGATWQEINPYGYGTWTAKVVNPHVAVDDADPDRVYLGFFSGENDSSPDLGLYVSHDRGDSWTQSAATAGLQVLSVAVEPGKPDHVVIGTVDGQFISSTDGGTTWSTPLIVGDAAHNFIAITRLVISPTRYAGHRKIWAISDDSVWVYYSSDDGVTWTPLAVSDGKQNKDIQYHDSIPGLIWAGVDGGYYSTDDGATWTALNAQISDINQFALVPGSPTREETTLYAGTKSGVFYSTDGGGTWVEKDQGLGGALPDALEVSSFNADEAFAAVPSKGMMRTQDGGRNWQLLTIPNGHDRPGLAADPFTPGKFYFASSDSLETPPIYITTDHGSSYTEHMLTLPVEFNGRSAETSAVAANPQTRDHLLAGLCLNYTHYPDPTEGLIYASSNGGDTWTQQTTPPTAKCINSLVYAPSDPNLVYAGTEGGLLVSVDGGANWAEPANHPNIQSVRTIAIDPRNSQSVYLDSDMGLLATHDGGDTWEKLAGVGDDPVWGLKIVPVGTEYWIYAATNGGLRFLRDIPAEGFDPNITWERSSGIAGVANVNSFDAAADGGRVVYYIGTSGGSTSTTTTNNPLLAASSVSQLMPGGIYRRQGAESAPPQVQIPGWQLKNKAGFGNINNAVTALEVFNGQIYAATSNWANGCHIWRSPDGKIWTPVGEYGMSPAYGSTNPFIYDLIVFKGSLYASLGLGTNEGQVWRSSNGTTWDKVSGSEWGGDSNQSITVMAIFDNDIYAFSSRSEVWRSSTGDSDSWVREAKDGFGNVNNLWATGTAVFNNQFYLEIANNVDGVTVWSKPSGGAWVQVNTSGFGSPQNTGAGGMAVLDGYLYVGVQNSVTGGQLWRYDGINWSQVVGDGFRDLHNTRINGPVTVRNQLFAVTNNTIEGLQVWHSGNGTQWTPLNLNGLGNIDNSTVLWSNASTVYGNTFYIGTNNGVSGGEIWQYVGFPIYLPDIRK